MKHTNEILTAQRRLIVGYLACLTALAVAIAFMPTNVLIWDIPSGSIYGQSILFWLSLIGAIVCYHCFKRKNAYFKKQAAKRPQKHFTLCRSKESKWLLLVTAAAFVLFAALPVSTLPRFILFAVCIFLLGLYLGANSYAYHIYRKHKSHVRRDENE